MVERAKGGIYSSLEVNRGLPAPYLNKYFEKFESGWRIHEDIKKMVEFSEMNLAKPWPYLPKMDIIFLRNVMIYLDVETKKEILKRIRQLLSPDGCLFLGGAETTLNLDESFERVQSGKAWYYRLRKGGV